MTRIIIIIIIALDLLSKTDGLQFMAISCVGGGEGAGVWMHSVCVITKQLPELTDKLLP